MNLDKDCRTSAYLRVPPHRHELHSLEIVLSQFRGSLTCASCEQELLDKCHPLGMFDSIATLAVASSMRELYRLVLVDTPLAPYFSESLSAGPPRSSLGVVCFLLAVNLQPQARLLRRLHIFEGIVCMLHNCIRLLGPIKLMARVYEGRSAFGVWCHAGAGLTQLWQTVSLSRAEGDMLPLWAAAVCEAACSSDLRSVMRVCRGPG